MVENAPNELKFRPEMYFKFQKIFGKFSKLADFWLKNGHFARIPRREITTFFSTENVSGPSKMLRIG